MAKPNTRIPQGAELKRFCEFQTIVETHQSLVWATAYSITGDASLSEDVAQETFLAAWNQQGDIRDMRKLKGYLTTIARNLGRKALRGTGREKLEDADFITKVETPDGSGPLEEVLKREEQSQISLALQQVPESSRQSFVLFYTEGQSVACVAETLNLSQAAVKQRLYRARQSLKSSLEQLLVKSITTGKPSKTFATVTIAFIATHSSVAGAALSSASESGGAAKALATTKTFGIAVKIAVALVVSSSIAILLFQAFSSSDNQVSIATAPLESTNSHTANTTPESVSENTGKPIESSKVHNSLHVTKTQAYIPSQIQGHWPKADIDQDGVLSEDEVLELRDQQEDTLVERIIEHWQDELCEIGGTPHLPNGVTCVFVMQGDDGHEYEGFIPYALENIRTRYEEEVDVGLDMDSKQWLAGVVATAQNKRICIEIEAGPHNQIHRFMSREPGKPLPWMVSLTLEGMKSVFFPPPAELLSELAKVLSETDTYDIAKRWGVQLFLMNVDQQRFAVSPPLTADWHRLPLAIRQASESAPRPAE